MNEKSIGLVKTEHLKLPLSRKGFKLESGKSLLEVNVAFERYGKLSKNKDNVIIICHALTGDSHAAGYHNSKNKNSSWWDIMIGPGKGIDTNKFHVICTNVLGGCKGTTGPCSKNPKTGKSYGSSFPDITIGDMVEVQKQLLDQLGIDEIYGVIGGSAGGNQALEWSLRYPEKVKNAVIIASGDSLSAQALSFDIIARNIIMADPFWNKGDYYNKKGPNQGLSLARMIGHITYLSKESMDKKFGRGRDLKKKSTPFATDFQVESYLKYKGEIFIERFDANSFLYITSALDAYSFGEKEKKSENAYKKVKANLMIVSVTSDWLYPAEQSKKLAENFLNVEKHVTYCNLDVPYGHDAFLIKNKELSDLISSFFRKTNSRNNKIATTEQIKTDYPLIEKMIFKKKRNKRDNLKILDLGSGKGLFLKQIIDNYNIIGHGIDIDINNIIASAKNKVSVFQVNLDEGLEMIPDKYYDYAVLSRTLLEVHKPELVLNELLRVAKIGIVSFPNFANWKHRLRLGLKGELPLSKQFPYQWYNTPNLHFLTLKDFRTFCKKKKIKILDITYSAEDIISKILARFRFKNAGADNLILKLTKK